MSAAEIEEAEMAITRSLQTIDANFSRACALVNGMVRKARHSVRSTKKVHGAVQPWKRLLASLAPPEVWMLPLPLAPANCGPALFVSAAERTVQ